MNIIIFGATGGIGRHAVRHALKKGYHVTAYVRNPQKLEITDDKLTAIKGELLDYTAVRKAVDGKDAVVWCVGIPMPPGYKEMNSLNGHKVLMKAMKDAGVKRLVDWATPSVPFAQDKKSFITVIPGIMAGIALPQAKKEMVAIGELVQNSDLDWTLVRFMAPKNSAYTGRVKVSFGDVKMRFNISREDIGAFMVEQIESKKYIKSMPIIGT